MKSDGRGRTEVRASVDAPEGGPTPLASQQDAEDGKTLSLQRAEGNTDTASVGREGRMEEVRREVVDRAVAEDAVGGWGACT